MKLKYSEWNIQCNEITSMGETNKRFKRIELHNKEETFKDRITKSSILINCKLSEILIGV